MCHDHVTGQGSTLNRHMTRSEFGPVCSKGMFVFLHSNTVAVCCCSRPLCVADSYRAGIRNYLLLETLVCCPEHRVEENKVLVRLKSQDTVLFIECKRNLKDVY